MSLSNCFTSTFFTLSLHRYVLCTLTSSIFVDIAVMMYRTITQHCITPSIEGIQLSLLHCSTGALRSMLPARYSTAQHRTYDSTHLTVISSALDSFFYGLHLQPTTPAFFISSFLPFFLSLLISMPLHLVQEFFSLILHEFDQLHSYLITYFSHSHLSHLFMLMYAAPIIVLTLPASLSLSFGYQDNNTALHIAADIGRGAIVQVLIDRNANINALGKVRLYLTSYKNLSVVIRSLHLCFLFVRLTQEIIPRAVQADLI